MEDSGTGGATAVITHQVRDSQHDEYELWLQKIVPLARASRGFLDVQVIRPVRGLTDRYTVILRFDCEDDLRRWLASPTRLRLIESAMPILAQGDSYTIHSGVDFLFTAHDGSQRVPVRWKQFLVTWSAIYPLTFVLPMLFGPPLDWLGWRNHLLMVAIVSASSVLLMVYVIMPRYTRLVRRWLFR
jgi:antibiotic biosynthesis monooxygenase (ABM) superfamily enzyme